MDALDVEMSIAEGEQALQTLPQFVREYAGTLEAHETEKGIFKRLLPDWVGGDEALLRPARDGRCGTGHPRGRWRALAARDSKLRGRDYFSLFGKVNGGEDPPPRTRRARDLPAGGAGQSPRAVLLVLPAGVDDRVRGRAPLQRECGLVRAAL